VTVPDRKAHPDEKGTERTNRRGLAGMGGSDRKAHPDEKGTESVTSHEKAHEAPLIARPIPMKRELKDRGRIPTGHRQSGSQGPSR